MMTSDGDDPTEAGAEDAPLVPDELKSTGGGTCYSGRNCTGKVLSSRDAHNCRDKSNGKSWRSPLDGTCYNL